MPEDDDTKALLQKLCTLQEQQLAKLTELVDGYTRGAESSARSRELWDKQLRLHEESQKTYDERAERHERSVRVRGIITLILWAAIAVAVFIHYFF
jgi:hypothetical protein